MLELGLIVMKILLPVKRVIDPYVKIRVKADGSGVETQNVKMGINPFDEIAIEEALRLKENNHADELIAVSIGEAIVQETLRSALALGVDRALHIDTDQALEPLNIAKILKVIAEREQPQLIMLGKQAIDSDNNQIGQMLAALLGQPQGTFASKVEMTGGEVTVTREVDGGLETLALKLPAVITTDLRLNEPRYATLPNIMKAKQKPLDSIPLSELGLSLDTHLSVEAVMPPPVRQAGEMVPDVSTLVNKLKTEAKVLA